jgi:glutamate transport system permease protein
VTVPFLSDALGPRSRRRVHVVTIVTGVVLAAVMVRALMLLGDRGQLAADKWRPFTDYRVLRFLLLGLAATLRVAVVAMTLAIAVGGMMALGRLARNGPIRWLSGAYVEIFRAIPVLLFIFFAARGLPQLGVDLSVFWYLVAGLVGYNSAVLGEIFRAGILSLDKGQSEAALAMGLSYWQSMFIVVIPQAVRRMVPAVVTQLVTLLKDTSLGFILPYEELLRRGQLVGEEPGKPLLQSLFVVALIYIAVNLSLSRVAHRLEVRQRKRYRAGVIAVSGLEDLAVVGTAAEPET